MAETSAPRFAVTRGLPARDIAGPLRDLLRTRLGAPDLEFDEAPSVILGGFDTSIFAFRVAHDDARWAQPLVLRLFRTPDEGERASYEGAIQNAVVSLGFPAPEVLLVEPDAGALGAPFTIMRRMPGRPMLDLLLGPQMRRMARLLGEQHARLHDLDAAAFRRAIGDAVDPRRISGVDDLMQRYAASVAVAQLDGLRPALRWLVEHRPPAPGREAICHGDFHPLNLLVSGGEVAGVVDWAWIGIGPAEADVGATVALLGHGPVAMPGPLLPVVRLVRRWIAGQYLGAYAAARPLDREAVRYFEAVRVFQFVLEAGEQLQAQAGVIQSDMQSPFFPPHIREGALRRLRAITRVDARLPAGA